MVEAAQLSLNLPSKTEYSLWIPGAQKEKSIEDDYLVGDVIGKGFSSVIHKCLYKGKTEWACKVYIKDHLNRKMVQAEIDTLLKLRHPNIIHLREVFETEAEIRLIMELVTGGELFDRIVEKGHFSEQDASQAVHQILSALEYLHSKEIVHRDLRPENLIYENEHECSKLKLADFGLSKKLHQIDSTSTMCGTIAYSAPEIILHKDYDSSVDIWSLGIITYIMLCGFEPFWDAEGDVDLAYHITEGKYSFPSPWWDEISDSAKELVQQLLQVDPLKRPSAATLLKHSWVRGETSKRKHMDGALMRLREFNGKRKFKVATCAVLAANRAMYLISPEKKPSNRSPEKHSNTFKT